VSDTTKFIIYFILGGLIVALSVHYGSKGNGLLAAFITQFPSISVLAFYLMYRDGGHAAVSGYAKGFLITIPPWVLYVLIVYFFCERIGAIASLTIGVTLYMFTSWLLSLWTPQAA
jgi:uncharacterized membrane protein (GlpM family)